MFTVLKILKKLPERKTLKTFSISHPLNSFSDSCRKKKVQVISFGSFDWAPHFSFTVIRRNYKMSGLILIFIVIIDLLRYPMRSDFALVFLSGTSPGCSAPSPQRKFEEWSKIYFSWYYINDPSSNFFKCPGKNCLKETLFRTIIVAK